MKNHKKVKLLSQDRGRLAPVDNSKERRCQSYVCGKPIPPHRGSSPYCCDQCCLDVNLVGEGSHSLE